jgi:uncharacterized protein (UPF0218 family)
MYYHLNPTVRKLLAHPMGELFSGPPAISLPKAILWMQSIRPSLFSSVYNTESSGIICVGDIISKAMIEHPQLSPLVKMAFIDGETQRGTKVKPKLPEGIIECTLSNPRGTINSEIADFIVKKFHDPLQYLVMIDGEEDLLVLPAVLESDEKAFIFYGQPPITDASPPIPAGCVGIFADSAIKQKYRTILNRFDIQN